MHEIRTTCGLVIASKTYGDAGKILFIFTKDLGLVMASAQGIRLEKSKLRPFVQNYSFGEFSFVRGREFWRLTDACEIVAPETEQAGFCEQHSPIAQKPACSVSGDSLELVAKIAALLKQFLHGEEAHPELFDCVLECNKFLENCEQPELNAERLSTLESLTVARILRLLGYIGDSAEFGDRLKSCEINTELLDVLVPKRVLLNKHINKAIKESHL
ncbi:recombination protein O N-terminal domain-containing protein [Patescibacteria group bacterium]|nr:recombination protein O N-terminal domain-containing protein [Patescibacteria group bacterium]MDE1946417.1 recombination protein O N-terminal domain-containing protein [Patescibacteria group bacterium]MDE2011026.1 recombination protein O N-terminal domain-containing protein [Patescibacteria group bacterium]MDE2233477.1 recombination protein O N-terminal domain-containing protein [Patescibacteria group bacterium]